MLLAAVAGDEPKRGLTNVELKGQMTMFLGGFTFLLVTFTTTYFNLLTYYSKPRYELDQYKNMKIQV